MLIAIFSIISVVYGVIAYFLLNSIIMGVVIALIFELVLVFLVRPMVSEYVVRTRRRHECYQFVYSFIVSLSSLNSGEGAYQSALEGATGEEKEISDALYQYSTREKLSYLANYFQEDYYKMFLSIYEIWEEQGGEVLDLASPLLNEVAEVEKNENKKDKVKMNNLVQFATLWGLSALILMAIRFGLSMFYEELSDSWLYLILSILYFLLVLGSSLYLALTYTGGKLKFEWRFKHASKTK